MDCRANQWIKCQRYLKCNPTQKQSKYTHNQDNKVGVTKNDTRSTRYTSN